MAARRIIDLRSDTVTLPTDAMREAMREAEVGDDVFGEDPSVKRLEASAAERMGKEAGLFMPSGTMVNQVAIMVHTQRRGEVVCEEGAHLLNYEAGAPSILSNVLIRAIAGKRGVFTPEDLDEAVRPKAIHFPQTTLVSIENTHNRAGGTVWTPAQTDAIVDASQARDLPVHLDGARIFNAAVAQGVDVRRLVGKADSVGFCFSKGLSAPVGSVLCGGREFIESARRVRKMLGGAMRQAGVLAAAAQVALDGMVERLADDHENARALAMALLKVPGVSIDLDSVQTNIVILDVAGLNVKPNRFVEELAHEGVRCLPRDTGSFVRMVTHRHVSRDDVAYAAQRVAHVAQRMQGGASVR